MSKAIDVTVSEFLSYMYYLMVDFLTSVQLTVLTVYIFLYGRAYLVSSMMYNSKIAIFFLQTIGNDILSTLTTERSLEECLVKSSGGSPL